jgi:hypothetical protein
MKGQVIHSQRVVLSSTRLEIRDQSENQKRYSERFVIKKEFNVRTVIIKCDCNRDVQ